MNRGPRRFAAFFTLVSALGSGFAPPSPSDGPQPAHLLLFGAILLGLVLLAVVLIRRWRKARPRAPVTPAKAEAAGRIPRHRPSTAGRALRAITRFVSIVIASILAVLFVVAAALVLVLFNLERTVFDPEVYKRALVERGFYVQFAALMADQFETQMAYIQRHAGVDIENMSATLELETCLREALGDEAFAQISGFEREAVDEEFTRMRPCFEQYVEAAPESEADRGGPPIVFQRLTPGHWGELFTILLPPDVLRPQLESTIDSVFALVDPDTTRGDVSMSLIPLREHLRGGAAAEAFAYVVQAQPPCTPEEMAELIAEPLGDLPSCNPPPEVLATLTDEGADLLADVLADMPEQADLTPFVLGPEQPDEPGRDPLDSIRIIRPWLRLSPLLPVVLLVLIALSGPRSWRGLLLWWGIPGLVVGLIVTVAPQWCCRRWTGRLRNSCWRTCPPALRRPWCKWGSTSRGTSCGRW